MAKSAKENVDFVPISQKVKFQNGETEKVIEIELKTDGKENQNDKIISQKEKLAAEVLQVAEDALEDIKVSMAEAGVRDLLNIFNSAIKTHRDLMSDIITIQTKETKEEEKLASQYTGKVDELLKRITGREE